MRLVTTFGGAGVLYGDLTPECAAVAGAVLDALSAPAGAQDTRTHEQRYHDALQEAMRRLVAAGLLPERAGQPVRALVHVSLADLIGLDGSSALMDGVDRPGPGAVGGAPRRRLGERQRRRRVAGRRPGPRVHLRRLGDPCGDR